MCVQIWPIFAGPVSNGFAIDWLHTILLCPWIWDKATNAEKICKNFNHRCFNISIPFWVTLFIIKLEIISLKFCFLYSGLSCGKQVLQLMLHLSLHCHTIYVIVVVGVVIYVLLLHMYCAWYFVYSRLEDLILWLHK